MSCSFVKSAIIASVLTRPRNAAAKSGADTAFSGVAVSVAHPPVANTMAATAMRIDLDLMTTAPRLDRRIFSGILEPQVGVDRGAGRSGVGAQQIGDRVDNEEPVRPGSRCGGGPGPREGIGALPGIARL